MNILKVMKVVVILKKVMKLNIPELLNYKKEIIEKIEKIERIEKIDINNFFVKPKYFAALSKYCKAHDISCIGTASVKYSKRK